MRKKPLWILPLVLILVSMLPTAVTASPTMVLVNPPVIWDSTMGPGTQFSVDICVDYVENLMGYQFWLSFDPDVIHGVSVANGPFLGSAGGMVMVAPGPGFDNEVGELKLFGAIIWWIGVPPDDILPDGGGVLATVTFEVVGYGCSPIILGSDTGLLDKYGGWIFYGSGKPGFFSNVEAGPELYVRRRGAHGTSGIWPEWHVGLDDDVQTLSCEVFNYGEMGAHVAVEFVVTGPAGFGIEEFMSEQAWVDAATWVGDDIVPSSVTVSVSFTPGIYGKYHMNAILYFEAGCMTEKAPYYLVEDALGGEGLSRDINVGFKVQTHL